MKSAWVKSDLRARAESCHSALLGMEAPRTPLPRWTEASLWPCYAFSAEIREKGC